MTILSNARILTFDRADRIIESGSVEVGADGAIGFVRDGRALGRNTVDLHGALLMPALINCHTHLYSTLARGMHPGGAPPADFPAILKKIWWRLDRALTEDDIYYSALIGLMESAKCGVATVIDHHSSPRTCAGSLDAIARAFHEAGLRGATCYEVSDRNGRRSAEEAIGENIRFIERQRSAGKTKPTVGAMFGLHASFTLSDRTLGACLEANQSLHAGFHVHVAEDRCDRLAARRLCQAGILDEKSIAAHCVHVSSGERTTLARRGVNIVHNPQSNCNNAVGIADLPALFRASACVGLGTDGCSPRLWDELKTAYYLQKIRARDSRVAAREVFSAFRNNREIVQKIFGWPIGRIETGTRADLLLLDYQPPTPIDSATLFGHLLFGIANAPVHSLMVEGRWVVRDGRCVTLDEPLVAEQAACRAKRLWDRL